MSPPRTGDDKPPKPPKPTVTVLTTTEVGALSNRSIKVQVGAKKTKTATASGTLLIDGFPEDFSFKLAPKKVNVKNGTGKARWGLSARKREVLDFAIKSCRPASVTVTAEARGRSRTVTQDLAVPAELLSQALPGGPTEEGVRLAKRTSGV